MSKYGKNKAAWQAEPDFLVKGKTKIQAKSSKACQL